MELASDISTLNQELEELNLLSTQATSEAERHETRRVKAEERVAAMERDPRVDLNELREARTQLLTLSRRAVLFEAQQQVLEGKSRTLVRYRDRLVELDQLLSGADQGPIKPAPGGSGTAGVRALGAGADDLHDMPDRATILRAQEELRRDIARHMHDGPAQSLANIALQAEIVQRLATRGDPRVSGELQSLRTMVQAALETTKEFIFDVRPMVLDDLGLVPTLRRTVLDRGRRAGIDVVFDSQGPLRRIDPDLESGLFRVIAEAATGYLQLRPSQLQVRLDWAETELYALVQAIWSIELPGGGKPTDDLPDDVPPALRAMIEANRSQDQQVKVAAHALPAELVTEIVERAQALGITVHVRDDGAAMEIAAKLS
ncbi:MAG: histidine kinase [Chloroflexota bacterium]